MSGGMDNDNRADSCWKRAQCGTVCHVDHWHTGPHTCGSKTCVVCNAQSTNSAKSSTPARLMIEWRDRVDGSFAWCGHYRLDIAPNGSEFDASVVESHGGQLLPRLNSPNLLSLDVAKAEATRLARIIIDADIKQLEELRSRLPCEPLTMAPGKIFV